MAEYTFRLRFTIPQSSTLEVPEPSLDLSGPHHPSLMLFAGETGKPIREAKTLVLKGSGHPSESEAIGAGESLRDALTLALAHCRIGADFGDRSGRGGFTTAGLRMIEDQSGQRVLNDPQGLMAYESDPPPRFARMGQPTLSLATPADKFTSAFNIAAVSDHALTDRERLSFSLFTSSCLHGSQDARLLFLVMSVEVLLVLRPRPAEVAQHVDTLIRITEEAASLPASQRDSIVGTLKWLRWESIRQASRRLISERLNGQKYGGRDAPDFFLHCYDLRSSLVHGSQPYPTRDEVGSAAANLEVLVANLLAARVDWAAA